MSIFWGTKLVGKNVGYVAEFCPLCRQIKPFVVERVKQVRHTHLIRVSPGKIIGYHKVCCHCKAWSPAVIEEYNTISQRLECIDKLIAATNPNIFETYAEALALEKLLQRGYEISEQERVKLLHAPFAYIESMVEEFFTSVPADSEIPRLFLFWVFVGVCLQFIAQEVWAEHYSEARAVIAFGVSFALLFFCYFRYMRFLAKWRKRMGYCLAKLNPDEEELREFFAESELTVCRYIDYKKLSEVVQKINEKEGEGPEAPGEC